MFSYLLKYSTKAWVTVDVGWGEGANTGESEGKKDREPDSEGKIDLPVKKRSRGWIWAYS